MGLVGFKGVLNWLVKLVFCCLGVLFKNCEVGVLGGGILLKVCDELVGLIVWYV